LGRDGRPFDVVIVDTPPTRNALDFLDAPRRLTAFLDNRVFRLLMTPTRVYLRAVGTAAQAMLKTIGRVVGREVVDDVVAFFAAFDGMEDGFRARAQSVRELLGDDRTGFVLITTPRPDAIVEARYFADRLRATDLEIDALVVNRIHPRISRQVPVPPLPANGDPAAEGVAGAGGHGGTPAEDRHPVADAGEILATLRANLADFDLLADREERRVALLANTVGSQSVVRVPHLEADVHNLESLGAVADALFEREVGGASYSSLSPRSSSPRSSPGPLGDG
jgi:anion-transporting  ArsA/GET3 family ATPase